MFNARIQEAFNDQLNAELYSAYLYLSMSAYFDSQNLAGMASWMRIQAREELSHAMKFFDFINERDGRVVLRQLDVPKSKWDSALNVFEEALGHEEKVTASINHLVDLALTEKDHASNTFLQWFVTEQIEEESNAKSIVDKLKMVGDNPVALYMVDGQLGQRVAPAADSTSE
ncbi:MAG: ferritin [Planctomycetota bacterium]